MVKKLEKDIIENGVNQGDLVKYLENVRDLVNAMQTLFLSDTLWSLPALAIGSTKTNVANGAFNYAINGNIYPEPALAAGTAPGNDVIPQAKFGAVAFDIGADGTIDVIEAAANATGYDSAALAIAGIAAVAADHVRMGTVTATKSDGAFTFGTTELDAANTTVAYTDGTPGINGLESTALKLTKG